MLNRVANIELNLTGKSRKKNYFKKNFSEIYIVNKFSVKDSLAISPAFQLLKKHSLEIRDFNKHSAENFELSFVIEEFLFQTRSNTSNIVKSHELEYIVRKKDGAEFEVDFLARTKISNRIEIFTNIDMKPFRFLFNRISDLRLSSAVHLQNTLALNNLLDKIYYEMLDGFTKLNYVVVRFIDLAQQKHLLKSCSETENFNEAIIIKKIQPIKEVNVY